MRKRSRLLSGDAATNASDNYNGTNDDIDNCSNNYNSKPYTGTNSKNDTCANTKANSGTDTGTNAISTSTADASAVSGRIDLPSGCHKRMHSSWILRSRRYLSSLHNRWF